MTDTQETGAEVIAEYRADADKMDAHELPQPTTQYLRIMLDRFDAAWKRDTKELRVEIERLKEERNYSGVRERERLRANGFAIVPKEQLERGDAAKLREALVSVQKKIHYLIGSLNVPNSLVANRMEINGIINAALSAPPRNCDVPLVVDGPADNNADKAWIVFKRQNPDAYFDVSGLLRCIDWLLAAATEKEGGAK